MVLKRDEKEKKKEKKRTKAYSTHSMEHRQPVQVGGVEEITAFFYFYFFIFYPSPPPRHQCTLTTYCLIENELSALPLLGYLVALFLQERKKILPKPMKARTLSPLL